MNLVTTIDEDDARDSPVATTYDQVRSRRKRAVGPRTLAVQRMTKRDRELGQRLFPQAEIDLISASRPRTRADCDNVVRPCPYVGCKYNLYLDVDRLSGSIKLNLPDLEPDQMTHSCALDVADAGSSTLEEVGEIVNLTRERVRQIEAKAAKRLTKKHLPLLEQLHEASLERQSTEDPMLFIATSSGGGAAGGVDDDEGDLDPEDRTPAVSLFTIPDDERGARHYLDKVYRAYERERVLTPSERSTLTEEAKKTMGLKREDVFEIVKANPGLTQGGVAEKMGQSVNPVGQHLLVLIKTGHLRTEGGKPRKYFAVDGASFDRRNEKPARGKATKRLSPTAAFRASRAKQGASKTNGVTHLPGTLVDTTVEDLLEARRALAVREVERIDAALEALRSA